MAANLPWWQVFFDLENRFFIPIIFGIAMLLTAIVTLLFIRNGRKKLPFGILWCCLGILNAVPIVFAQINAFEFFTYRLYLVGILTMTGIISVLVCAAMLFIIHIVKPKKNEQANEIEKMNIHDL